MALRIASGAKQQIQTRYKRGAIVKN